MLPGKFASSSAGQVLFGSFAGGVTAELTGGNFWMGAVTGATVSWLNHVAHKLSDKFQEDPLKKNADQVKHTLEEWEARYHDKSWREIATESGWKHGQPLGPHKDWRYIRAPDGKIMDMRHVSIVGYAYGEGIGNAVEYLQNLIPIMRRSAFDPQDYYSNKIGAYFCQMRHSGSWSSSSWAYDFKRFIDTQYSVLFKNYKP
ncbi:hypothetical protein [Flavobacterium aurantiibacter]|uniref:Uncharacterized protein n=1 Tax=Flavobacterium aurantiibacter TaxID=2023067 RepID=A0A256AA74_9FLAO|nr:hypothetical protein [Flavobacterium aurantiibacter]OYQ50040.1 hypothetical protein CHX27_01030 [Flavobacterium aurantiibacter]